MKNYLKLLILSIAFISITSCKDDEEEIPLCLNYVSLNANINYVDDTGKDLIFGDSPVYPHEKIKIYKILANDEPSLISFTINKDSKCLIVPLSYEENGTFYIELKPGVTDKITHTAKINENSPCGEYKLIDIKQNDLLGQYNEKTQVWTLKK
ncbi:hypothetical protein HX021_17900 [Sphingobacterium sp. N143]|uniref:hypothetical protein n=1 Tax=Sphingobacterium sp. N143 TaxID=2746727 RepID=UPI002576EA07|nr:hypothetical protein [Sphingobacterium sp. N143]MDM1296163.1 hypothetical protein [Sphingobacterium sp. N143]